MGDTQPLLWELILSMFMGTWTFFFWATLILTWGWTKNRCPSFLHMLSRCSMIFWTKERRPGWFYPFHSWVASRCWPTTRLCYTAASPSSPWSTPTCCSETVDSNGKHTKSYWKWAIWNSGWIPISMVIFHSYVHVYQRVFQWNKALLVVFLSFMTGSTIWYLVLYSLITGHFSPDYRSHVTSE